MPLEHEADNVGPKGLELPGAVPGDVMPKEVQLSAIGFAEQPQDLQQSALAGSAGPCEADALAEFHLEVDVVEDLLLSIGSGVGFGDAPGDEAIRPRRFRGCWGCR